MKFNVKDEDGKQFEVEEVVEDETAAGSLPAQSEPALKSDSELLPEEVQSLKKLAAVADKLVELISSANPAETGVADEDNDEDDEDEDKNNEHVVSTNDSAAHDSNINRSIGANEPAKTTVNDSEEDVVANAWSKRYGGKH